MRAGHQRATDERNRPATEDSRPVADHPAPTVLLLGYGNPGRLDDGLGPAVAAQVERLGLPGVTVQSDYQLCLEDAEAAARHDVVIFADAAASGSEPFSFQKVEPAPCLGFTTHSLQPEVVLGLAQHLFGARTQGYCLGVRGYAFNEYRESLTERGRANLAAAVAFVRQTCEQDRSFERATADFALPRGRSSAETVNSET
jgi:hydrogenase maturation protease